MVRPSTSQMALGREVLFLPDDHPLLQTVNDLVLIQGCVVALLDGPSLTRLELIIHMNDNEANALVTSLMTDRGESLILEVAEVVWLPGA